jgi:ABC-type spermidine/putrescine transport system permease subunit II
MTWAAGGGIAVLSLADLVLGSSAHGVSDLNYAILLVLSAVGSILLLVVAATALRRRRSQPYLLLTGALGALVLRPIAGTGVALGLFPMEYHHLVEHFLDVCIAACLLAALYTVRAPTDGSIDDEHAYETDD